MLRKDTVVLASNIKQSSLYLQLFRRTSEARHDEEVAFLLPPPRQRIRTLPNCSATVFSNLPVV